MTGESPTFRVGQEVEVTYRARVAEVVAGSPLPGAVMLRLEAVESGNYATPPGGWLSPSAVNVKIVKQALPTEAGMYWLFVGLDEQKSQNDYHSDGYEFYYLNREGKWCDVGWGFPHASGMAGRLARTALLPGQDLT